MSSIEDLLILEYSKNHSGEIFKEVPVGQIENKKRQRRIDAILIEGNEHEIYEQGTYDINELHKKVKGKKIHLIEAKKNLGRYVVGQVEVGIYLFKKEFKPAEVSGVALCSKNNTDVEKYCNLKNINVIIYSAKQLGFSDNNNVNKEEGKEDKKEIKDVRSDPDNLRLGAFKRGWGAAVKGKLYKSIKKKRTHANMGNLHGWIYGDCSDEKKEKIWNQYIENTEKF